MLLLNYIQHSSRDIGIPFERIRLRLNKRHLPRVSSRRNLQKFIARELTRKYLANASRIQRRALSKAAKQTD